MKNIFKKFLCLALSCVSMAVMFACADKEDKSDSYTDYSTSDCRIDKTVFYRNDGTVKAADPSVITVGDTFYMYATNAEADMDCSYIRGWKSKNLTDWTLIGNVFTPARTAWAVNTLWAPEVIEKSGKYYMYYSGFDILKNRLGIGLAVSDSPEGPFKEIEGEFGGKTYTKEECPFDFGYAVIDPSPFIDDNGDVYLYFSQDQKDKVSSIYGCKLQSDMVSVEKGSVTAEPLVYPSQKWEGINSVNKWNEAPFMVKHGGKYMLFYSANYYQKNNYSVGVAISDNPLKNFEKPESNPILAVNADWTWVSGTGHCSVFPSPDKKELFMAYHCHVDTANGGSQRKIAFDRLVFDENGNPVVNGPSVTPQLLPSGSGKYINLTPYSTVTSGDEKLKDGIINYNYSSVDEKERLFNSKSTVKFNFTQDVSCKGVMIYDSADYFTSAKTITVKVGSKTYNIKFSDKNRYIDEYDYEIKIVGSCAAVLFKDETVAKEVSLITGGGVALSEVAIIGNSMR